MGYEKFHRSLESKVVDPAAAAFEAIQASKKKKTDILLIDTAGRLPNNKNLIEELKKIRRVISKVGDQFEGAHVDCD